MASQQDLPPRVERLDTYAQWQAGEGIPIYDTFFVEDMKTLELGPWARTGGLGAFVNLEGAGDTNNCYVAEVPLGGTTKPQRHLYEEMVYVLEGIQHCMRYELDITRDPIPVAPAAHYMMGGVATDLWGRTTLPGLLACGEVANTGVHGANRLASNSLLETVVFAQRAVEADPGTAAIDAVKLELPADAAPADRETLRALLWDSAGIVRDGGGLRSARTLLDSFHDGPTQNSRDELTNMTLYGRLIVEAALRREESRGAHFRSDFPTTRDGWARSQSFEAAP